MDKPIAISTTGMPGEALYVVVLTESGRVWAAQWGNQPEWTEITPAADTAWRRGADAE